MPNCSSEEQFARTKLLIWAAPLFSSSSEAGVSHSMFFWYVDIGAERFWLEEGHIHQKIPDLTFTTLFKNNGFYVVSEIL